MSNFAFEIPFIPDKKWSLNAIYSGIHWAKRKKQKKFIKKIVQLSLNSKNLREFSVPVSIKMQFNSRLDVSNHGYLFKMIEDCIVEFGIIKDDSDKFVKESVMTKQNYYKGIVICISEY